MFDECPLYSYGNAVCFMPINVQQHDFAKVALCAQPPLERTAAKVRSRAGFSDATGVMFELRGALPGVGEALKREIAGLVLVDRLWLWGFGRLACLESGLTDPLTVVCWAKRCAGFAGIWPMNVVPCRCYPFLRR